MHIKKRNKNALRSKNSLGIPEQDWFLVIHEVLVNVKYRTKNLGGNHKKSCGYIPGKNLRDNATGLEKIDAEVCEQEKEQR